MRLHPSRAAFGVVEMLVVFAVVAVLAVLLLPALSGVRERGVNADCVSNLRQISVAVLLYANDHQGQYPPNRTNRLFWDDKYTAGVHWQDQLEPYLPGYTYKEKSVSTRSYRDAAPFWCPADLKRKEVHPWQSYGVNRERGGGPDDPAAFKPENLRIAAEPNPAQCLYLAEATRGDLSTSNISAKAWPFGKNSLEVIPDGATQVRIDFRHSGRANVLFVDGHVTAFTPEQLHGLTPNRIAH